MMRDRKDRSANWIIESHGDSLLRLAKVSGFTSWQASSTVMSFPKQMPDGLLDVTFPNRPGPDPFLIEIETYPDQETATQLRDDAAMVILTRGVLPDILLIVLHPKGNLIGSPEQVLASAHGLSDLRLRIRVVNLWTIPAAELLAANDVGLIPWLPLTDFSGTPESLLQICKERIERDASPEEKGNLLAGTRAMAEMKYNSPQLLSLLGEQSMTMQKVWDQSPFIQRIKAEAARNTTRRHILHSLEKRFGQIPEDLAAHLQTIDDQVKLDALFDSAVECASLEVFRAALTDAR
jgi:hypothetical protein